MHFVRSLHTLGLAAGLGWVAATPLAAQKIQETRTPAVYHKSPALVLAPPYSTYSVENDLGNTVMAVNSRPELQGLKYQKEGGDLLLRLTTKNLYVTNRKIREHTTRNGVYTTNGEISYSADYGYELRNVKTNQVLAQTHKNGGIVSTRDFSAPADLNSYLTNAFVAEQTRFMFEGTSRQADFALNPHDYPITLTLATVDGAAPAYAAINQAVADLKALLAAHPVAPPAPAAVVALAAVWQQHLAKANWEEKKSEINKKVASALLRNLCAAALLTEDYANLRTWSAEFSRRNAGFFDSMPAGFLVRGGYGGNVTQASFATTTNYQTETVQPVYYDELVADVLPAN